MKPKLILLHGALGSKRYFEKLKSELSQHCEVYDLDFSGHGEHQFEGDFSIDLFSTNLIDFLKDNGLEKMNVFGYSMGGYVAITAAGLFPNSFDKIITYGTKFNWSPEIATHEVKMLNPEKIEEKVPKFAKSLAKLHGPNDWKDVMHKTGELMLSLGNGSGLKSKDLKEVNHAVTIGWGSADKMVSELESKNVVDQLPNGKFAEIENQPHPIEMVDVDVLVAYILDHLG